MNVPTEHDTLEIVSGGSLERELNRVRAAVADSLSGIFGLQSVTWQVSREAAVFLGAGRTLLLQLSHPWAAAAIEQHSDTFADPLGRFHRTFSVAFTMVFGTLDQSLGAASPPVALSSCRDQRHVAVGGGTAQAPFIARMPSPRCAGSIRSWRCSVCCRLAIIYMIGGKVSSNASMSEWGDAGAPRPDSFYE